MKKLLFALLVFLATSTLAQEQTRDTIVKKQLPTEVQQALLDMQQRDMDRRIEYLQHDQTRFLTIAGIGLTLLGILVAVGVFITGYVINKNLGEKFQSKEREMETRMQLLEKDIALRLANLNMQVELSEKSLEETRLKINKAVDQAVCQAVERVQEKTDEETEAFSQQVKTQIEYAQKALNEINATKDEAQKNAEEIKASNDKVKELVKELENSKGEPSPELQKEIKEQVEKTEKEKDESEYTADDWFLKGVEATKLKNYENAATYYKKAHDLEPQNERILDNWGNTLGRLEKYEEAIPKHKKSIEINPNHPNTYQNWNLTLSLLQDSSPEIYPLTLQEFKDVLEKNKDIPELKDSEVFQKIYNKHFST